MAPTATESTNRPYPPPGSVSVILDRIRRRNIPDVVDSEYLRDAGITDSLNSRVMFGLRFLGLVEGDLPTPALRSIGTSTDEEYQAILAQLVREAYEDVFRVVDPAQEPQERILNFFRRYTPASQRDRMVTFFLGMCREAGIPTLDAPRNRPTTASSGTQSARTKTAQVQPKGGSKGSAGKGSAGKGSTPSSTPTPAGNSYDGAGANPRMAPAYDLPPALELLIRSLPAAGSVFPQARRAQWMKMAEAALSFIYLDQEPEAARRSRDFSEEEDEESE